MLNWLGLLRLTAFVLFFLGGAKAQASNIATISSRCDANVINAAVNDVLTYIKVADNAIDLLKSTTNVWADLDIYNLHVNAHVNFGTALLPANTGYSSADIMTFEYFQKTYRDARNFWSGQQYTRNTVDDSRAITTQTQTFVANPYNVYITCARPGDAQTDWQQVQYICDLQPSAPDAQRSVAQDPRYSGRNLQFIRIPQAAPFFTLDGTATGLNARIFEGGACDAQRTAFTVGSNTERWKFRPVTVLTFCSRWFDYPSLGTIGRDPQNNDDPEDFVTRGAILLHETFHAFGFFMHDNRIRFNSDGFIFPGYRPRSMYAVNQNLGTVLTPPPYNGRGTSGFPDAYSFFAIQANYPGISWDIFKPVTV